MITCFVTIMFMNMPAIVPMRGRVVLKSKNYYLADFTKDAKKLGYPGYFKYRIVEIGKCSK